MKYKTIWKNKRNQRMFHYMKKKVQKYESQKAPLGRIIVQELSGRSSSEYGRSWRDTAQSFSQRSKSKQKWMLTENSCTQITLSTNFNEGSRCRGAAVLFYEVHQTSLSNVVMA